MSNQLNVSGEKHPKQDFQVERIAFFSDAVFAIAITLLVIEFHPPVITKDTTAAGLAHQLGEMKFKLAAMILSFALIVSYWRRHHTLFKYIHNYNKQIIMANMVLLLPIIFFPFTTSFLYESVSADNPLVVVPYRMFFLNHVLAGATTYFFYWTVIKRFKEMSFPMTKEDASAFERRLLIMTLTFLLVFILSFISFTYSFLGVVPMALTRLWKPKKSLPKKNIHAEQKSSAGN